MRRSRLITITALLGLLLFTNHLFSDNVNDLQAQAAEQTVFFLEDFDRDTLSEAWYPLGSWTFDQDSGNDFLKGTQPGLAHLTIGQDWSDYALTFRCRLFDGGLRIYFRMAFEESGYAIKFTEHEVSLFKVGPWGNYERLIVREIPYDFATIWIDLEILVEGGHF